MSALGQKQTFNDGWPMSALPPKADIGTQPRDVCFVPKADISGCLLDPIIDLITEQEEINWLGQQSLGAAF